jgi:hypothetical protein
MPTDLPSSKQSIHQSSSWSSYVQVIFQAFQATKSRPVICIFRFTKHKSSSHPTGIPNSIPSQKTSLVPTESSSSRFPASFSIFLPSSSPSELCVVQSGSSGSTKYKESPISVISSNPDTSHSLSARNGLQIVQLIGVDDLPIQGSVRPSHTRDSVRHRVRCCP